MWTCPKCGEAIEDQFDSCWKCSDRPQESAALAPPRLKSSNYISAALVAYLIPWLALCIQSSTSHWRTAILTDGIHSGALLVMLVPATINFLVLLPFLKSSIKSRFVAGLLLVGWTLLAVSLRA